MKKLIISDLSMYQTYSLISKNGNFTPKQYLELVTVVIYLLLKGDIFLLEKVKPIFIEKTAENSILVKKEVLNKALYYMDATVRLDAKNNVIFSLHGLYSKQILSLLYILLQDRKLLIKPDFNSVTFYESVYTSICNKLKLEQDSEFLFFLQNMRKKSKVLVTKSFIIIGPKNISEIELYSKYDYFDKEYCDNYRFIIIKSNDTAYPVGSYVFGKIQSDKVSVILYQNPECTLLL